MDLKYLLHVSIPLWDHPQGAVDLSNFSPTLFYAP